MQKTFVFLCSEASKRIALTALASDAHEQYNIVFVDSINAEQILADNHLAIITPSLPSV